MVEWSRNTPWRQGHVLPEEAAVALSLSKDSIIVVISHDCDLSAVPDKEPAVEVICGRLVNDQDHGNFAHAKAARILHIPFVCGDETQWVELAATEKVSISKTKLVEFSPRTDFRLESPGNVILQHWLAARYKRAAFPDAFDKRLEDSGLRDKLTRILEPLGEHIRAIFFDLDDGKEIEHIGPDDTYVLVIHLLYFTESDPEKAQAAAEKASEEIERAFRAKLSSPTGQWMFIELRECSVISDQSMTIWQSLQFKEWRLEHLSLRKDPPDPTLRG